MVFFDEDKILNIWIEFQLYDHKLYKNYYLERPYLIYQCCGIEEFSAPIHISNVQLVDPKSGDATKVGRKLNKDGKLQRFAKKSGELIK